MPLDRVSSSATSLLQFPCSFPIKIMGECTDGFAEQICALVKTHAPDFDPSSIEMRPSRNGNYLGLTVTIDAQSQNQLDHLYQALTKHPLVKVVL
jgi:uncharacterized protein